MNRLKIFIVFIIIPALSFAQSDELTKLKNKKKQIQAQINSLELELQEINAKIIKLEQSGGNSGGVVTTVNSYGGILRDKPSALGTELALIKEGEQVTVLNEHVGLYLKVIYKGKTGYLNYSSLNTNTEIDNIISDKTVDNTKTQTIVRTVDTSDPKYKRLASLYGKDNAVKIINHELWKGMSMGMVIESIGKPNEKKSVNTLDGLKETWIYPDKEVVFLNGEVDSWSDK
ncbi:MAG: hypothetical protein Kow0068_12020 [Marinilabiliales bacterium]